MSDNEVLASLKAMGLVKPGRVLVHRKKHDSNFNAVAVRFPIPKIVLIGDSSRFSEQAVAFTMLHEEGHIVQRQNLGLLKALWIILFLAAYITLFIWRGGDLVSILALLILSLVLIAISPLAFRSFLMNDEIRADRFAGIQLGHLASDLSETQVQMLLNEALEPTKKGTIFRRIKIALGWDWHPPRNERVRIVYEGICQSRSDSR